MKVCNFLKSSPGKFSESVKIASGIRLSDR